MGTPFRQPNPLIGRRRELDILTQQLADPENRLITLTGVGGIGKTRLAQEAIGVLKDDFDDGIVFIELAAVGDPALLPEQLLTTLGDPLPNAGRVDEAVFNRLESDMILIVLDNLEHLLESRGFIEQLLLRCPDVVVLVTSRERLNLDAEQVIELTPLGMPDQHAPQSVDTIAASESVQLFLQRARLVDREYELTEENAGDVAAICRRLDGLPLAIELAASRVAEVPPRLILRNFTRILPFLERSSNDPFHRHRTMHNAIDWSYHLLDETEQRLFRRLSSFESGCSLTGAQAVFADRPPNAESEPMTSSESADLINHLNSLISKHFLTRQDRETSEARYGMLETLREFGRVALRAAGEFDTVRETHARHIINVVLEYRSHIQGPSPGIWLDRTNVELPEIRAAYHWLMEAGGPEHAGSALLLCNRLDYFWEWRGHAKEGERFITDALERIEDKNTFECLAGYLTLGNLETADLDRIRRFYEKSFDIARAIDYQNGIAGILSNLAMNSEHRGDFKQALHDHKEALDRFRQLEFLPGVVICETHLGIVLIRLGNLPEANEHLESARALAVQLDDEIGAAWAMVEIGLIDRIQGRLLEARELFDWCLDRFTTAGVSQGLRRCHNELGWLAVIQNDLESARGAFLTSLRHSLASLDLDLNHIIALEGLAWIALESGNPQLAVHILAAVERWYTITKQRRANDRMQRVEEIRARAGKLLGDESFEHAWTRGELESIEQITARVLLIDFDPTPKPGPEQPESASQPFGLTPKEGQVICLIALGKTNRQIAKELFMSERTVAVHVQHILAKLEATNRTHASAIARDSGICAPN